MLRQLAGRGLRAHGQLQKVACPAVSRGFADGAPAIQEDEYAFGGSSVASNPITQQGVAGRYAAALFMSARKAKVLPDVSKDIEEISDTAADSEELRNFLKDPSIPRSVKQQGLDAILDKLKCKDITKNFLALLNENNRLPDFMKISTTFEELCSHARGEVLATITSAQPLSREELQEITEDSLGKLLEKGQKLKIQQKIDPKIIGGVIVNIGDKLLDLSIATRIKRLQQRIMETV